MATASNLNTSNMNHWVSMSWEGEGADGWTDPSHQARSTPWLPPVTQPLHANGGPP